MSGGSMTDKLKPMIEDARQLREDWNHATTEQKLNRAQNILQRVIECSYQTHIDPATREALEAAVDALNAEAAQQKVRADWFKPGSSGYQSRMDVAQEYTAHAAAIEKLMGGE